jgi:hypothetical protein
LSEDASHQKTSGRRLNGSKRLDRWGKPPAATPQRLTHQPSQDHHEQHQDEADAGRVSRPPPAIIGASTGKWQAEVAEGHGSRRSFRPGSVPSNGQMVRRSKSDIVPMMRCCCAAPVKLDSECRGSKPKKRPGTTRQWSTESRKSG